MQLNDMPGVTITFVVIAVILGIGATILSTVRTNQCGDIIGATWNATSQQCENATGSAVTSFAYNASTQGMIGLDNMSGWQPTLAIIVVAAVVIGVIGFFYLQNRR
jgi:hypothetical protein